MERTLDPNIYLVASQNTNESIAAYERDFVQRQTAHKRRVSMCVHIIHIKCMHTCMCITCFKYGSRMAVVLLTICELKSQTPILHHHTYMYMDNKYIMTSKLSIVIIYFLDHNYFSESNF